MRSKPPRGLQDIVTRSNLSSDAENPQRKYLRVASLELRKAMCQKVRDAARKRSEEMDAKLHELETEEAGLLAPPSATDMAPPPRDVIPPPAGVPSRRGIRLRY